MTARSCRRMACCALLALFPVRAFAHPELVASAPPKDATLTTPPRQLHLTFSEPVELALSSLTLLGSGNNVIVLGKLGRPSDSTRTIVAAIAANLANGKYTVKWHAVGTDGHSTRGEFSFAVEFKTQGESSLGAGELPPFDSGSPAFVAVRFLRYSALLAFIGAIAFTIGVLPRVRSSGAFDASAFRRDATTRAQLLARWSASLLLISAPLRLVAQVASVGDVGATRDPAMYETVVLHTGWGRAWQAEVATTIVLLLVLSMKRRRVVWLVAALAALVFAVEGALAGHAVTAQGRAGVAIAADTLHVLGAGGWLGSLLAIALVGVPAALALEAEGSKLAVRSLVQSFSPTALVWSSVLALSGTVSAWTHFARLDQLWLTQYGRTLLIKLALVGAVVGVGAYHWRRTLPALGGSESTASFERSVRLELVLAGAVVACTAVLVGLATPPELAS